MSRLLSRRLGSSCDCDWCGAVQPHKITSVEFTHWMDTASCRIYGEISHSVHFNHSASVGSRRGRGTGAGRHRSFLFPLLPLRFEQIEFCDGGRPKAEEFSNGTKQGSKATYIMTLLLIDTCNRYIAIGLLGGTELGTGCSCCSGHYCAETTGGEL